MKSRTINRPRSLEAFSFHIHSTFNGPVPDPSRFNAGPDLEINAVLSLQPRLSGDWRLHPDVRSNGHVRRAMTKILGVDVTFFLEIVIKTSTNEVERVHPNTRKRGSTFESNTRDFPSDQPPRIWNEADDDRNIP